MNAFVKRHAATIIVLIVIGIVTLFTHDVWKRYDYKDPFQFTQDIRTYYSYLPVILIHNDIGFTQQNEMGYWLVEGENGKHIPRFTMGYAYLYLPFFLLGHMNAMMTDGPATGFTAPYSTAMMSGTLVYVFIGFILLLQTLSAYFSKVAVTIAGICIFFGTNLMHYTLGEGEAIHSTVFFCFCCVIFFTLRWWKNQKLFDLIGLSLFSGIAFLERPTEIFILLIPIGWNIYDRVTLVERVKYFRDRWKLLLLAMSIFILPSIPQLFFWKANTGSFFPYTYGREHFFFGSPRILDFVIGYRKGWLLYSPMLFGAIIGLFLLKRYMKPLSKVLVIHLILTIYVLSCWWSWWYGGSFGNRAMVQYDALLIFPLAALIEHTFKSKNLPYLVTPLLAYFIYFNILFTYKYDHGMVHYDSMTKDAFWFTIKKKKFDYPGDYEKFNTLLEAPDYEGAMTNKNR